MSEHATIAEAKQVMQDLKFEMFAALIEDGDLKYLKTKTLEVYSAFMKQVSTSTSRGYDEAYIGWLKQYPPLVTDGSQEQGDALLAFYQMFDRESRKYVRG